MEGQRNIHADINYRATVDAWAQITIKNWKQHLKKKRIGNSGSLDASLKYRLIRRGDGMVTGIYMYYNFYGRFVDMGVGRGTRIGDVKENALSRRLEGRRKGNQRRAKKWFSNVLYAETINLTILMKNKYAASGRALVVDALDGETINMSI